MSDSFFKYLISAVQQVPDEDQLLFKRLIQISHDAQHFTGNFFL